MCGLVRLRNLSVTQGRCKALTGKWPDRDLSLKNITPSYKGMADGVRGCQGLGRKEMGSDSVMDMGFLSGMMIMLKK